MQKEMRSTGGSDKSLQLTQPIPPKHHIDATIRLTASNFEYKGKDKTLAKSSDRRQKKKKQNKKQPLRTT